MIFRVNVSARVVGAALLLMVASPGGAVELSLDGSGQVLFYPYFTVNGGNQTLLELRDGYGTTSAVRVRFRDGRTGAAALDLNVYLRPHDSWVAALALDASSGTAKLVIPPDETSCVLASHDELSLGDVREGFVEVIKMGDINGRLDDDQRATELETAVEAADCEILSQAWAQGGVWAESEGKVGIRNYAASSVAGPLSGSGAIVNVEAGWSASYQATGIQSFFLPAADVAGDIQGRSSLHFAPTDSQPTLFDANTEALTGDRDVIRSTLRYGGQIMEVDWQRSDNSGRGAIDAISAVLMAGEISASFNVDPALDAASELVLSMPTAHYYAGASPLAQLFGRTYITNREGDRPEQTVTPIANCDFCLWVFTEDVSTAVVAVSRDIVDGVIGNVNHTATLDEVPSRLFASTISTSVPLPLPRSGNFTTGKVDIYPHSELSLSDDGTELNGHPVIGFVLTVLRNGTISDSSGNRVLSTYALTAPLQTIAPDPR